MARPEIRLNLQDPTLRPSASPVDTFFQPQPPIPGEAVDNEWLQIARSMKGMSASLDRFMGAIEKQKQEQEPQVAALAKRGILGKDVTDEQLKKNWQESLKAQSMQGASKQAEPPTFILQAEKSKYLQERQALARRFASMTREEATTFLQENQKMFPGTVLNYAARPDFILNLKAQLGGDWVRNSKSFEDKDGNLTTYERARASRITEQAQSEDPEAWLREFEGPLAEGLDVERGQQFILGALDTLSPIRSKFANYVEGQVMAVRQQQTEELTIQELYESGVGTGSIQAWLYQGPPDKILPTDDPDTIREKETRNAARKEAADAGMSEWKNAFYAVGTRSDLKPDQKRKLQTAAITQISEYLQDIDDELPDQFIDMVMSMSSSLDSAKGKPLSQVAYWDDTMRGLREKLDTRAKKKEQGPRPDYTNATRLGMANAMKAITEAKEEEAKEEGSKIDMKSTEDFETFFAGVDGFTAGVAKRLVESGYSSKNADDLAPVLVRELAANLAQNERAGSDQMTARSQIEYDDIVNQITLHGSTDTLRTRISDSGLPMERQNALLALVNSEDARSTALLGYGDIAGDIETTVNDLYGQGLSANGTRKRDAAVRTQVNLFQKKWRASDQKGKEELGKSFIDKLVKDFQDNKSTNGKLLDDTLNESAVRNPSKIVDSFGKEFMGQIEAALKGALPDRIIDTESYQGGMKLDPDAVLRRQDAMDVAQARTVKLVKRYLEIDAELEEPQYTDPSDVSRWGPEILNHIKLGTKPANFPKNFKPPGRGRMIRESYIIPAGVAEGEVGVDALATGTDFQLQRKQVNRFEQNLPVNLVDGSGSEQASEVAKSPMKADEAMKKGFVGAGANMAMYQHSAAAQILGGPDYEEYAAAARQHLTAPDNTYISGASRGLHPGIPLYSLDVDPVNYPSSNESNIFWLSAFMNGDDAGRPETTFLYIGEYEGDWFYDRGQELYGEGSKQREIWKQRLQGEIVHRGLLLEEIILGETREGVSFEDLGWKEGTDIPWGDMIIGSQDNDKWTEDLRQFMDKGKLTEGWEKTLVGQALTKLGVNPERLDTRFMKSDGKTAMSQWDFWQRTQTSLRELRSSLNLGARPKDQLLHNIPRIDSSLTAWEWHRHQEYKNVSLLPAGQQTGRGTSGTVSGGSDWRMYGPAYTNSNERTKAFERAQKKMRGGK